MEFPRRPGDRGRLPGSWRSDPLTVDGYVDGGVPWPVETSRFAYLAPVGGFSEDVPAGRLGLHKQALAENTALQPGDSVTLSIFEGGRPIPYMARPTFEVMALDFEVPDAFLRSTEGEAVLSLEDLELEHLGLEELAEHVRVIINGVLAVRLRGKAG